MKPIDQWLREYEVSHTNATNRRIHKIAVPSIVFSILLLLWPVNVVGTSFNAAQLVSLGVLFYYAFLSWRFCAAMALSVGAMMFLIEYLALNTAIPLQPLGLSIFVLAWIFQFIGHKIEGKKPSFLQDIVFLLIGPLWTLHTIFPGKFLSQR
jgi:uncharacterized membrane protein YGL010W